MTFIDEEDGTPTRAELYAFVFTAAMAAYCAARAHYLGYRGAGHYRSAGLILRFGFPVSCLIFCMENVLLCIKSQSFFKSHDARTFLDAFFALHALLVPIWLVHTFEMCYLMHKRRSVNWCGLYFDEGHRVKTNLKSFVLRNFIRILAMMLLVIGIIVNFDLVRNDEVDILAGKTGWHSLLSHEHDDNQVHLFLSLLPILVLFVTNIIISISMWHYGATRALVVYPSYFNPWIQSFIGTLLLGVGQCFSDSWYPALSNIGQALFLFSLVREMKEIDKELTAEQFFEEFLEDVKDVGNGTSISSKTTSIIP